MCRSWPWRPRSPPALRLLPYLPSLRHARLSPAPDNRTERGTRELTTCAESLARTELGRKWDLSVEDRAEIRRLRRAGRMSISGSRGVGVLEEHGAGGGELG
jgi:hypothetical protein